MANASLIENFLESLASEKGLSKNTIQSYSLDIKQCLKITKLNIDKISSKNLNLDIEKYIASLNAKGFERSTVLRKISALGHFFNFLVEEEILESNPIKKINIPIAAPSANISSKVSPTDASHVFDEFKNK